MTTKNDEILKTLSDMGLSLDAVFVPFSQSRNKAEKSPSLNWKVTLKKNDKPILTTDYMAGCGHCPSYKQNTKNTYDYMQLIKAECETGFKNKYGYSMSVIIPDKKSPLLPDIKGVVYSLVMDSDVLEYDFSDWCSNFGYDEDSRTAEKIYNACMEIALKLNRSLGADGLNALREVYRDY